MGLALPEIKQKGMSPTPRPTLEAHLEPHLVSTAVFSVFLLLIFLKPACP